MENVIMFPKPTEKYLEYACKDCGSNTFELIDTGHVYCANCDAEMKNLTISED